MTTPTSVSSAVASVSSFSSEAESSDSTPLVQSYGVSSEPSTPRSDVGESEDRDQGIDIDNHLDDILSRLPMISSNKKPPPSIRFSMHYKAQFGCLVSMVLIEILTFAALTT